ncbi:hypothetical protein TVAG_505230 [Trichomonas vaginalis G3]|uniref:Uncharacterized protein n=1 Tax=Trichomonas vaginalis (strain ATCC PRA-98 / G3) TaxID=412133 RepID=A2GHQ8_TRIV3|nr:hypothetical protein TVAGG3_0542770 [Trichomonas vaginalis G3]EAX83310.1 hypothetical protein TVAG_505230 [Trichomonas vaginalis G3]KAI5519958.1 hypothetical protein TVAGG3_0542770 [Trichomonas vaginalis G3]|eukprot:XP_001296240.1 hypothetical protein [Trichomonas vaginalis G3]
MTTNDQGEEGTIEPTDDQRRIRLTMPRKFVNNLDVDETPHTLDSEMEEEQELKDLEEKLRERPLPIEPEEKLRERPLPIEPEEEQERTASRLEASSKHIFHHLAREKKELLSQNLQFYAKKESMLEEVYGGYSDDEQRNLYRAINMLEILSSCQRSPEKEQMVLQMIPPSDREAVFDAFYYQIEKKLEDLAEENTPALVESMKIKSFKAAASKSYETIDEEGTLDYEETLHSREEKERIAHNTIKGQFQIDMFTREEYNAAYSYVRSRGFNWMYIILRFFTVEIFDNTRTAMKEYLEHELITVMIRLLLDNTPEIQKLYKDTFHDLSQGKHLDTKTEKHVTVSMLKMVK